MPRGFLLKENHAALILLLPVWKGFLLPDMEKSPFPVISFLLCTYAVYARPGKIVRINATTRAVIVVFNTVVINTYL